MATFGNTNISALIESVTLPNCHTMQFRSATAPTVDPETIPDSPTTIPLPPAPDPAPLTVPGMEPVPDSEPIPDQCPRMYVPTV